MKSYYFQAKTQSIKKKLNPQQHTYEWLKNPINSNT